jgi:hypothetical protein
VSIVVRYAARFTPCRCFPIEASRCRTCLPAFEGVEETDPLPAAGVQRWPHPGRPRYESRTIWYAWSVGVVVPKRALTT